MSALEALGFISGSDREQGEGTVLRWAQHAWDSVLTFLKGVSKLMSDACRNHLDPMNRHLLAAIDADNDSEKVKRGRKLADVLRRTQRSHVKGVARFEVWLTSEWGNIVANCIDRPLIIIARNNVAHHDRSTISFQLYTPRPLHGVELFMGHASGLNKIESSQRLAGGIQ